jgi:hypothetical protein
LAAERNPIVMQKSADRITKLGAAPARIKAWGSGTAATLTIMPPGLTVLYRLELWFAFGSALILFMKNPSEKQNLVIFGFRWEGPEEKELYKHSVQYTERQPRSINMRRKNCPKEDKQRYISLNYISVRRKQRKQNPVRESLTQDSNNVKV